MGGGDLCDLLDMGVRRGRPHQGICYTVGGEAWALDFEERREVKTSNELTCFHGQSKIYIDKVGSHSLPLFGNLRCHLL